MSVTENFLGLYTTTIPPPLGESLPFFPCDGTFYSLPRRAGAVREFPANPAELPGRSIVDQMLHDTIQQLS